MKILYYIEGYTYQVKNELKNLGCLWNPIIKKWYTDDKDIFVKANEIVSKKEDISQSSITSVSTSVNRQNRHGSYNDQSQSAPRNKTTTHFHKNTQREKDQITYERLGKELRNLQYYNDVEDDHIKEIKEQRKKLKKKLSNILNY